jgi:hypothetical protein
LLGKTVNINWSTGLATALRWKSLWKRSRDLVPFRARTVWVCLEAFSGLPLKVIVNEEDRGLYEKAAALHYNRADA